MQAGGREGASSSLLVNHRHLALLISQSPTRCPYDWLTTKKFHLIGYSPTLSLLDWSITKTAALCCMILVLYSPFYSEQCAIEQFDGGVPFANH